MIKPSLPDSVINVKLLTNPKNFYKLKTLSKIDTPKDLHMTIKNSQRPLSNTTAAEIENLTDNVAIILQSLRHKCLIKVNPAEQNLSVVQEHLEQVLKNLRDQMKTSYDRVIGIVAGGKAYDPANSYADKSIKFTDMVCEFLEREHIPSTKLLEQRLDKNSKGMELYSYRNDVVLTGDVINNLSKSNPNTKEELMEAGEEFFDVFEISSQAPVKIVNEILPAQNVAKKYL